MAKKTRPRDAGKPDVDLGKKLRSLRNDRGMSQIDLGTMLGISFQQIQKYEKGLNRVSSARLQQIAKIFDVSLDHFYGVSGHVEGSDSLMRGMDAATVRMLRIYSRITNQETQRQMVMLIEAIADEYD